MSSGFFYRSEPEYPLLMHTAKQYLKYVLKAKTAHGVHSPFVYDFITQVLQPDKHYYAYPKLEHWRNKILNDSREIEITDYGAGSRKFTSNKRVIGKMAETAGTPLKYLRLFYRMMNHYQIKNVLELGTSCGITTGYLSTAAPSAQIDSVEGCPQTHSVAREFLYRLNVKNANLICGEFDEVLHSNAMQDKTYDFIFIDGNHREESTVRYFNILLNHAHAHTFFVFDDIHWSVEMTRAWETVKSSSRVYLTFDLYKMGIALIDPKFKKQHFQLKF